MRSLVFLFALVAVAYGQEEEATYTDYVCPESYGHFPDEAYCDYYWQCSNGEPTLMECKDGHSYNPNMLGAIYPCDYTFKVDCTGREQLRDPKPTQDAICEREYGLYPDPELCSIYYVCQEGVATLQRCSANSHFKISTGECVWPYDSGRTNCDGGESLNGFVCPAAARNAVDINGLRDFNPTYADPNDCRYYYVCQSGKTPQLAGCSDGYVFNNVTKICDEPANVPDCISYYETAFEEGDSFTE